MKCTYKPDTMDPHSTDEFIVLVADKKMLEDWRAEIKEQNSTLANESPQAKGENLTSVVAFYRQVSRAPLMLQSSSANSLMVALSRSSRL